MTPEERSRLEIDRQLGACGWVVQDYREMNLGARSGIAVREFPLGTGEADYLLYADGRAIGIVEAKPEPSAATCWPNARCIRFCGSPLASFTLKV